MLTTDDHTDLGALIAFAVQPTLRPGRSAEYRRVLVRYRTEPDFRSATNAVLHGLGARPLSDGEFGLVLGITPESPFSFRYNDLPHTATRQGRLLAGLVLVGLAAWAFPNPADLEDPRPRHVPEVEFETWLRETCGRLRSTDAAGEAIPEEGLDAAWRVYLDMPITMVGDKGRGTGRLSPKCTLYWVRAVLGWLGEQGMARQDQTGDGGPATWSLTERFRIHVVDMAAEPAYRYLAALGRGDVPGPADGAAPRPPGPVAAQPDQDQDDDEGDDVDDLDETDEIEEARA